MTSNKIIREDLDTIFKSNVNWSKFYGATVLITGANGFLPAYLVESLLYLNCIDPKNEVKVLALVRNIDNAKQRFAGYLSDQNLSFIIQDVAEVIEISEKVDYIIHAASQASPKFYGTDPVGTLKANILGTLNLLELARQNDVKSFLYFSSAEVYGEVNSEKELITETSYGSLDPTQVRACYSESKRMGENICVSYSHQFQVPIKIARPFHTYGPGMKFNDGRVFADFTADLFHNRNIMMRSDGSAKRAYCYLADAIIAYFMILLNGANGEAYNVGNPDNEASVLELANRLVKIFPEKNLSVIRLENENSIYMPSTISRIIPDISKIKALGWKPLFSIEEGFERTVNSYVH